MNLNLQGKGAVVCGSTEGIGKAAAIELANLGASCLLISRNEDKLKAVLKELDLSKNQSHKYIVADFDHPESLKSELDAFLNDEMNFEILINNSGGPAGGKAIDAQLDEFRIAFNRHLICNQILAQAFTPYMKKSGYGRIINVISTSVKAPLNGLGVSNTVRGAVANWAKTLANELGEFGITVNNILPGATMTGRLEAIIKSKSEKTGQTEKVVSDGMRSAIPAARFAEAWEVAAAIAFLASPAAGYINGINLPVDGGRLSNL